MVTKEHGKGGNFDTRTNPFLDLSAAGGTRPELSSAVMLLQAMDRLIDAGCAIIIGSTRDGGALCFTILDNADRHRTYCSTEAELDAAVTAILEMYDRG